MREPCIGRRAEFAIRRTGMGWGVRGGGITAVDHRDKKGLGFQ